MCPDKKLKWFDQNEGWRTEDRAAVSELVHTRWKETYLPLSSGESQAPPTDSQPSRKTGNAVPRPVSSIFFLQDTV